MKKTTKQRGGKRTGAGRKPIGDRPMVQIVTQLPPEVAAKIDKRRGTRSAVVREIVTDWLTRTK